MTDRFPPATELPYRLHTLELGPMENFVYLIEDCGSRRAAVVDPAWEPEEILALVNAHELTLTDILLTHSHHDHINGVAQILEAAPTARIHLLRAEAEFWQPHLERPQIHHGGDRIALGATEIHCLHTPGHTPGSACYHLPAGHDLISGDTLFVFGCGRCDLAGGDPEQMFHTLKALREQLPACSQVRPGHNYSVQPSSTLAEEVAGNPFLHFDQVDAFVHYRQHTHDRVRQSPYGPMPISPELP